MEFLKLALPLDLFRGKGKKTAYVFAFWIIVAVFSIVQSLVTHRLNNYHIFENTVFNLLHQQSLYAVYPEIHFDVNHYGPIFSVFFMPFAAFPTAIGFTIWNLFTTVFLFRAIATLPLKNLFPIYLIAIPCLVSSCLSQQSNPLIGAFIILTYTQLNRNKGLWSSFLIVLGTFIKLYGIVGLAFFFFVKVKFRFIAYLMMWAAILFILPMLFSSPTFILNAYHEWFIALVQKNATNLIESSIDISIMGFFRHLFDSPYLPNSIFLLPGIALFFIPYFRFANYQYLNFQLLILASTLLFPVLFSTGAEDCTYIIAVAGVGIWYVLTQPKQWKNYLMVVVFIFSCNFPQFIYHDVALQHPISLTILSLPFFIVWLLILVEAFRFKPKRHEI